MSATRVYVPTTLEGLAGFVLEGGIAETAARVEAADESEEAEYDALMAAAETSAGLLDGPGKRVVVVAEASDPTGVIPMRLVVAVHVDTEDDAGPDADLAWYATQEIHDLLPKV
ncbi:MAG: hypothetical protein ABWX84_14735 [Nocardioides sp.]